MKGILALLVSVVAHTAYAQDATPPAGVPPTVHEGTARTAWVQIAPERWHVLVQPCGPIPQCIIEISPEGRPAPGTASK